MVAAVRRTRVVLHGARVIDGHVVLDLVPGDEPEFAVGALVYVAHGVESRAATFPLVGNQLTIRGDTHGHL